MLFHDETGETSMKNRTKRHVYLLQPLTSLRVELARVLRRDRVWDGGRGVILQL